MGSRADQSTPTLTDFLLARIAEREAQAQAARSPVEFLKGNLVYEHGGHWYVGLNGDSLVDDIMKGLANAMTDPAAVLADCEAQRRVVQEVARAEAPGSYYGWEEGHTHGEWDMAQAVLRLTALRYADHPDYREEWKP